MSETPTLVRRLARLRVPLGFLFGALVLWLAAPTPRSLVLGAAIAALGEAMRIWAAGHLNKSREVTSSGPYRWFAHPLYVGSSIMGMGLAVASWSPIVAALVATYLGATLTAAIKSEEAFLRRRSSAIATTATGAARRRRRGRAPAIQPPAGARESRVPRARGPRARDLAAGLEGNV